MEAGLLVGRKAVAALGLRERWFHIEFFRLLAAMQESLSFIQARA